MRGDFEPMRAHELGQGIMRVANQIKQNAIKVYVSNSMRLEGEYVQFLEGDFRMVYK